MIIAAGNDGQYGRLCEALGLAELAADPKFATNPIRNANREELVEQLKASTRTYSSKELQALLRGIKVPCGSIQTIDQVFSDPQVLARGMVVDLTHAKYGAVKTVANPIKYSVTKVEYHKAPPSLGEDTNRVLQDVLGLSAERVAQLREQGLV